MKRVRCARAGSSGRNTGAGSTIGSGSTVVTAASATGAGVGVETAQTPEISLQQIYVLDPNQVKVEINIRGEI